MYHISQLSPSVQGDIYKKHAKYFGQPNWWMPTYDEAADMGLAITQLRLGTDRWLNGNLTLPMAEVVRNILANHSSTSATYQVALQYQRLDETVGTAAALTRALCDAYLARLEETIYSTVDWVAVERHVRGLSTRYDLEGHPVPSVVS